MGISTFMLKMMSKSGKKIKTHLDEITKNPEGEQSKLLFQLLENSKETELGKELGFADIKTVEDFQSKVPFTDFDFYAEKIDRMTKGAENVMVSEKIEHYNITSGTLGTPKRIPVTKKHVKNFSNYYAKYMNHLASTIVGDDWVKGKGLSLTEGTYTILPSGASCGSASSLMAAKIGKLIPGLKLDMTGDLYSSPLEARSPAPGTPTRYLHTLFALREKNITYGNCTFSSYLLEIMRYIEDNWKSLVETIRTGNIPDDLISSDEMRATLAKKLKPSEERANELEEIFKNGFEEPVAKKIWPNLKYFVCVGGGGFRIYTDKLIERYFGKEIKFLFLGLSASEGLFSVPFEENNVSSVFVPDSVFMEFIPADEDEDSDKCLLLHQLELGKQYEIVVTNLGGLFRYRMKDVIKVVDFYNKTPVMEFVKRAGFAISMYGEKTSEQALHFMAQKTVEELKLDMYDYAVCPDDDTAPGKYVLCLELRDFNNKVPLETIRATAQKYLSQANPSIGAKMDSGIVLPLELKLIQPESFLLYRDIMIMKGRNPAQLKPIHVLGTPFLKNFFYKLVEE